jgi:ribosome maturation factor RimP
VELQEVVEGTLSRLGYEVLEWNLGGRGKTRVLLVRIERKDEVPVAVADLSRASRVLGAELDRLDLIPDAYRLEVESPGPERPLISARHFERFMGLKAKVRSNQGNFTARVQMVRENEVDFLLENQETQTLKLGSFKANLAEWPEKPR